MVDALRAAAADTIAQGAPRSAVTYLRRALAEPPAGEEHTAVLRDLGFAESYAGDPDAARHLDEALARAQAALLSGSQPRSALGAMLQLTGQTVRAVAVYDRTLRRIAGEDVEAEVKVQSALVSAALFELSTAAVAIRHLPELRRRAEEMASPPSAVFGPLAFAATGANEPPFGWLGSLAARWQMSRDCPLRRLIARRSSITRVRRSCGQRPTTRLNRSSIGRSQRRSV